MNPQKKRKKQASCTSYFAPGAKTPANRHSTLHHQRSRKNSAEGACPVGVFHAKTLLVLGDNGGLPSDKSRGWREKACTGGQQRSTTRGKDELTT